MSKSEQELASLLAFRDGEPVSADAEIDPEKLEQIESVGQALRSMPDVPIGDHVWDRIQAGRHAPATPSCQ